MAKYFKNPDLAQIWDALQDGNSATLLGEILNALLPTNNLISFKTFTAAEITNGANGILELYESWTSANVDYVILNETFGIDPTSGQTYLLVRYRGLNLMAEDPGA